MKCIYSIINLKNGKQYIGSTSNLYRRKQKHFYLLRSNKHHSLSLQNSWNKNSEEDFKFIILKELDDEEDCYIEEQKYLDRYKTYNKKYGYNMSKYSEAPYGGNKKTVYQFSLDGKLINSFNSCSEAGNSLKIDNSGLSKCAREKYRFYGGYIWSYVKTLSKDRLDLANNQIKRSDESRLKMSISAQNRNCIKAIFQYDLEGNFIKEWKNSKELCKEMGYSNGYISDTLNNKYNKAYGYKWKFKENE